MQESITQIMARLPQTYYKEEIQKLIDSNGEHVYKTDYTTKFMFSLENYPPPTPFELLVDDSTTQPRSDGYTQYRRLHVRFKWQNNYAENSWQIDGDMYNFAKPTRYWTIMTDNAGQVQNRTEAEVTLGSKANTERGNKTDWVILEMNILSQPQPKKGSFNGNTNNAPSGVAQTAEPKTAAETVDVVNNGTNQRPAGAIGSDDQIPSPWIMPLHYYQEKDLKLGRQSAIENMATFVSSEQANVQDRKLFRWMIANLWNGTSPEIEIPEAIERQVLQWGPPPKEKVDEDNEELSESSDTKENETSS